MDSMNTKGLQLLGQLKSLPGFEVDVVEDDLDTVNHKWETTNAVSKREMAFGT